MKIYIWEVVHKRSQRGNQTLICEHRARHVSCFRPGAKHGRVPEQAGLSKVGAEQTPDLVCRSLIYRLRYLPLGT
jgi:hypothetical protein